MSRRREALPANPRASAPAPAAKAGPTPRLKKVVRDPVVPPSGTAGSVTPPPPRSDRVPKDLVEPDEEPAVRAEPAPAPTAPGKGGGRKASAAASAAGGHPPAQLPSRGRRTLALPGNPQGPREILLSWLGNEYLANTLVVNLLLVYRTAPVRNLEGYLYAFVVADVVVAPDRAMDRLSVPGVYQAADRDPRGLFHEMIQLDQDEHRGLVKLGHTITTPTARLAEWNAPRRKLGLPPYRLLFSCAVRWSKMAELLVHRVFQEKRVLIPSLDEKIQAAAAGTLEAYRTKAAAPGRQPAMIMMMTWEVEWFRVTADQARQAMEIVGWAVAGVTGEPPTEAWRTMGDYGTAPLLERVFDELDINAAAAKA